MAIQFYLTSAGRNAALNAASLGLNVSLTHIAVGSGKYDPSNAMTLTNAALVSEIERYPLNGGSVEPLSHTLRFVANIEPTQTADGYEIGLITDQGVLFAIAATTSNTPLIRLVANIVSIVTFGMILSNLNLSNLIISIDPNTPICVALMNQHLDHPDPHTQYLLKTDFNAGVIALQNNKYDKTGGELNGNILLKGYLELTGGRTVAKLYAADFLRLELNHPLLINDAVNVSNVVAATDLTVSDNGSTSITHSNTEVEGNFVRFRSSRDKYVFDKNIYAPNLNPIGVGQSWVDLTNSRAFDTDYINDTAKPIMVNAAPEGYEVTDGEKIAAYVDGVLVYAVQGATGGANHYQTYNVSFIVPPGATYRINGLNRALFHWAELR